VTLTSNVRSLAPLGMILLSRRHCVVLSALHSQHYDVEWLPHWKPAVTIAECENDSSRQPTLSPLHEFVLPSPGIQHHSHREMTAICVSAKLHPDCSQLVMKFFQGIAPVNVRRVIWRGRRRG